MPLRDYRCTKCGTISEHLVKHDNTNAPTTCDARLESEARGEFTATVTCEGALERVEGIPKTSFELRGSGWAADGYR